VRFPVTRPTIVLGNTGDGRLHEVRTADIRLMGNAYPYYTANGGVECYVVEARAREDWLPGYYAPRILYWLDKHSFYPLRAEQYGPDGKLALVEVRLTDMFNPAVGERGYGPLLIVYWDVPNDIMTYMSRDNHRLKHWTPEEGELFFNPDFMRRQWYLDASVKTQVDVSQPEQFFLRPTLEEGKFPTERQLQLSPEIAAHLQAQDAAGRLVFEVKPTPPVATVAVEPASAVKETGANEATPEGNVVDAYTQHAEQAPPTTLR